MIYKENDESNTVLIGRTERDRKIIFLWIFVPTLIALNIYNHLSSSGASALHWITTAVILYVVYLMIRILKTRRMMKKTNLVTSCLRLSTALHKKYGFIEDTNALTNKKNTSVTEDIVAVKTLRGQSFDIKLELSSDDTELIALRTDGTPFPVRYGYEMQAETSTTNSK